jgi:hypothetical protein
MAIGGDRDRDREKAERERLDKRFPFLSHRQTATSTQVRGTL